MRSRLLRGLILLAHFMLVFFLTQRRLIIRIKRRVQASSGYLSNVLVCLSILFSWELDGMLFQEEILFSKFHIRHDLFFFGEGAIIEWLVAGTVVIFGEDERVSEGLDIIVPIHVLDLI